MNDYKFKGLVCNVKKTGERDRLLSILTDNMGVINAFAPGASIIKSKKQASSQLLCYSEFTVSEKNGTMRIKEADLIEMFYDIRQDVLKFALGQYFCEVSCLLAPSDEGSEDYLKILLNCLAFLAMSKYPDKHIKSVFELNLLTISGYMPDLMLESSKSYAENKLYLDCVNGQLVTENEVFNNSCIFVPVSVLKAMIFIMNNDFKNSFAFTLSEQGYDMLDKICEKYLLTQLDTNFKTLKIYKDLLKELY